MGRITRYREFEKDGSTVSHDRWDIAYVAGTGLIDFERTSQKKVESGGTNTYVAYTDNFYSAGLLTSSAADNYKNGVDEGSNGMLDTSTSYSYAWWGGPQISSSTFDSDTNSGSNSTWTSTYAYDGLGRVASVDIADGRRRTVSFAYTPPASAGAGLSQILHRKERSGVSVNPEDNRYFLSGTQIGELTNNGWEDPDLENYASNLKLRNKTSNTQAAPFRWNMTGPATGGRFGTSPGYDPINPFGNGAATSGSNYTARSGDTLQSIAASIWGDASLWYLIAEANGMGGGAELIAGQSIALPDRVTNAHNNASTFEVYDPNRALGDLNPTTPKPAKGNKCGMMGQILMVVIAVAVTALLRVPVTGLITGALGGSAAAGAATVGAIAGGAVAGAAGSIASQAFGIAAGIQSGFDWKGVGLAALGGAIGGGLGKAGGIFGRSDFVGGAARGLVGSILNQGIGVATGLQDSFDWAGVAGAALGGGISDGVADRLGGLGEFAAQQIGGGAGAIANAAARSLITGTSFGDNLIAALPDVIGSTIGNALVAGVQGGGSRGTKKLDPVPIAMERIQLASNALGSSIASDASLNLVPEFGGTCPPGREADCVEIQYLDLRTTTADQIAQYLADANRLPTRVANRDAIIANLSQALAERIIINRMSFSNTLSEIGGALNSIRRFTLNFDNGVSILGGAATINGNGLDILWGGARIDSDGVGILWGGAEINREGGSLLWGGAEVNRNGGSLLWGGARVDGSSVSAGWGAVEVNNDGVSILGINIPNTGFRITESGGNIVQNAPQSVQVRPAPAASGPNTNNVYDLFRNNAPGDVPGRYEALRVQDVMRMNSRSLIYVVREDGSLVMARGNAQWGHVDLARGGPVRAAGEFGIVGGRIRSINNQSGHYRPSGPSAQSQALRAFERAGFSVSNSIYREVRRGQ